MSGSVYADAHAEQLPPRKKLNPLALIGKKFEDRRRQLCLTQTQVSEKSGVHVSRIGALENAYSSSPRRTYQELLAIAEALESDLQIIPFPSHTLGETPLSAFIAHARQECKSLVIELVPRAN